MNNRYDLLFELVRTGFKLRYNNSTLGLIWVLLKPLLLFTILYIVFSNFKIPGMDNYALYLLIGTTIYGFFSESIIFGMNSLLDKSHIVLKVNFSKEIALLSSITLAVINGIINLLVLVVFIWISPVHFQVTTLLYFFFLLLLIPTIAYSVSLFTCIMCLKFRDLQDIVEILLQLFFYLTPIIFPITFLPEKLHFAPWFNPRFFVEINPLTIIVQASREALILGNITYVKEVCIIIVVTMILLAIGRIYFQKNIKKVTEFF